MSFGAKILPTNTPATIASLNSQYPRWALVDERVRHAVQSSISKKKLARVNETRKTAKYPEQLLSLQSVIAKFEEEQSSEVELLEKHAPLDPIPNDREISLYLKMRAATALTMTRAT